MSKKILKWIGGIILVVLILAIATPFLFKGKIQELVVETINKNIKAEVTFEKVDLSLLKNFPKATVIVKNLSVVNEAPFEGDTLFFAEDIGLRMSVMELFKGKNQPMAIEGIGVKNALVHVIVNEEGVANYDIVLTEEEDKEEEESETDAAFSLALQKYGIENLDLIYTDRSSDMQFRVRDLQHSGSGNLADNILDLDTKSKAKVSFEKEGTRWLNNVSLALKAVIGMDLTTNTYTFKENEALINQLPLSFDGSLQLLEDGQVYDLAFATPNSSFKNFLGLVPEAYSGDIQKVNTEGEFRVEGEIKGKLTDTHIPQMAIVLASDKASFKYPDLPKSVDNIVLDAKIMNETGLMKDTYVLLNRLAFQIDQDVFNAHATIKNVTENAMVDAQLKGVVNLANLTQAYPVQLDKPLSGVLKADVNTHFDMNSVEKNQYQNIRNSGSMVLSGFNFESEEMAKPLHIGEASLTFSPTQVRLTKLDLKTGDTDLLASGSLDNFYGFLFGKQELKGNFNLNSTNFVVADLLKAEEPQEGKASASSSASSDSEPLKIPSFLDCTIHANAKSVTYDNLVMKNVVGTLVIKDEKALLKNMKTDIFDGQIAFDGSVSTKEKTPDFDMTLGLNSLDIGKSFTELGVLKAIAPIAGIISGKINSTVKLNGKLDANTLSPVMGSLSGDLLGQLLATKLEPENSKLMTALTQNINFIDLNKLNLDNIKTHLVFNDGKVQVKPFDIKYQDISVQVGGEHGFDKSMNYSLNFDVPAKYLGKELSGALSKLSASEVDKLGPIPVKVGLTGSFNSPKVTTDMKEVASNLATQLIEQQKNELIGKGTDALSNLLGGGKKEEATEESKTDKQESQEDKKEEIINKVGEGLKDLFGKKKK